MKKGLVLFVAATVGGSILLAGCGRGPADRPPTETGAEKSAPAAANEEAEVRTAMATLDPEDRTRAEAQRWCAVEDENRLGSMGTPYKVMVNDQPVFLCCKGCRRMALADPDKTLAKVDALKAKAAGAATR